MTNSFLIGMDFGTASARGTLVDVASARQVMAVERPYRHGVLSSHLPTGEPLPPNFALQAPSDYLDAAERILDQLGRDRNIEAIGIGCTASSPLPTLADGTPLASLYPREKHAYVKLWKHTAAQSFADAIRARHGSYLDRFGGKLSGEWLLPKAAEVQAQAPELWKEAARYIEAGDWIVWQLTGNEVRSRDFACYKALFSDHAGFPIDLMPELESRLASPHPVGTRAGRLTDAWLRRTGIGGNAYVAAAAIDAHAALPAVGGSASGTFLGVLGTSAGFLVVDRQIRPSPKGLEAAAYDAALPDLWCCEAGQAAFGDTLSWFLNTFPKHATLDENFAAYGDLASRLRPGETGLLALDWFGGNRTPFGDASLTGVLIGLTIGTQAEGIYRALIESLCYGARLIIDLAVDQEISISRLVFTGNMTRNQFLMQTLSDVIGREIEAPNIVMPTALGAAIHGAVCASLVSDFADGADRFGSAEGALFRPDAKRHSAYERLYAEYSKLVDDPTLRAVLKSVQTMRSNLWNRTTTPN